jgi:hypothetical protein
LTWGLAASAESILPDEGKVANVFAGDTVDLHPSGRVENLYF